MGDFSRDSNDPRKHYSGVLMQQGRVQLDADWNEQLAIQLRRTEIEAVDTIGACGVPKKAGGFQIGLTPNVLDLTISPGRIYVEGLLCELDATPFTIEFVPNAPNRVSVESLHVDGLSLAAGQWVEISAAGKSNTKLLQITGVDPTARVLTLDTTVLDYQNVGQAWLRRVTTLRTQPDYPSADLAGLITGQPGQQASPPASPPKSPPASPPASPLSSPPPSPPPSPLTSPPQADGLFLVYVDAWKREVTALDDTHLREVALGGPDTATRLKNIWQVKLLRVTPPQGGGVKCASKFAEWDALAAASSGRMNARTRPPEDEKDPCLLPPNTGFTRLENQLYRVEVQRGGTRQTATFKWSRDNAVVRTAVTKVSNNVLTVADVGRDETLSFAGGQWVEITDEESVLKGSPRQLVEIEGVNATTRAVTLKTTPSGLAGRKNLQLVRWDQTGNAANADGLAMTGGWVDLEAGVQVRFSEGTYRAGDYWLIPARTATGRIEWPPFDDPAAAPVAQPPLGTRHHLCRLALVEVKAGIINLRDCRKLFPALTDICAEDICVDNTACDLPDVENLQDMLDRLCAARDLRWHNKHLHGWGIVCGFQVECGPQLREERTRRTVLVRPGYALDCEGRDIVLERTDRLDLIQMIDDARLDLPASPVRGKDAEVCLVLELDEEGRRRYRVEKYQPPANQWKSLLSGTLLMDFYERCVKSLVDIIKEEFEPDVDEEGALVGPARKRAITFSNLFIQSANPVNGSRVFLSGDRQRPERDHEHTILRNSYEHLRERLSSRTFCAMFEGARPFPEYPFTDTGISIIFGRGPHNRLRVRPDGRAAYTCGVDDRINVYDLEQNVMVASLVFPGGKGAIVRDVAFSEDGKQLFAVASQGTRDSMFAVADISGFKHSFRQPPVVCDVQLVTLMTNSLAPGKVFAIGKGKGLYEFDPKNVPATPQPRHAFNATGQLASEDGFELAFAAAAAPPTGSPPSTAAQTDVYDRVQRLNLVGSPAPQTTLFLSQTGAPVTGRDDIAFVRGGAVVGAAPTQKLYVVIDPPAGQSNKQLVIFNNPASTTSQSRADLGENTRVRLAHNPVTNLMMVTFEDTYRVGILNADDRLTGIFQPAQISPISIVADAERSRVYVLNFNPAGNTINAYPARRFSPSIQFDFPALVNYRADVLEAFMDLLGGLLQYLKDCFCDLLLVNCPTCDPDDKIYLACVQVKDRQVLKVCNFSLRKYVKSFPTVEYWLSLFPVIPLVGKMFEEFCCAVLPNFFGRYKARRDTVNEDGFQTSENRFKGQQAETGVAFARQTDFRAIINDQLAKVGAGRKIVREAASSNIAARQEEPQQQPGPSVASSEVSGMKVEEARAKLEAAGVIVDGVEKYDPRRGRRNLARLVRTPARLKPGSRVTLVEQDGVVRIAEETPSTPGSLREELEENRRQMAANRAALQRAEALQQEVGSLREELKAARQSHADEIEARDKQIGELRETTKDFRTQIKTLALLREQVERLAAGGSKNIKEQSQPQEAEGASKGRAGRKSRKGGKSSGGGPSGAEK